MVDPDNLEAQDHLTGFCVPGLALQRMVITLEDFQQIISKYLDEQVEQQKQLEFKTQLMSNLQGLDLLDLPDDQTDILDTAIQDPEAAPVIARE